MKHVISDKYSIAWFKLAQCIAKGERERAMGIYRLLSHSIENIAYAKQLEADLYLYFQDTQSAVHKYKEAAAVYKEHQAYIQAIALYEYCLVIKPQDLIALAELFKLTMMLHDSQKIFSTAQLYIAVACDQDGYQQAQQVLLQVLTLQPSVAWVTHNAVIMLRAHAQQSSSDADVAPLISALIETLTGYEPYDLHKVLEHLQQHVPRYQALIQTITGR